MINWKKGIFSSKYKLFSENEKIGELKEKAFSSCAYGSLDEKQVKFKKKGIFSSTIEIMDQTLDENVGHIKFNAWGNKAKIFFEDRELQWKYDNFWGTKWSILENGQAVARYKSSTTSGEIESAIDDEFLLLAGLFVYNHYVQIAVIVAVSTAIIASR